MQQLSRRRFIRWIVLLGVMVTVGWRALKPVKAELPELPRLKNFSPRQTEILAAVYTAITDDERNLSQALPILDEFCSTLPSGIVFEAKAALHLLDQTPLFFNAYLGRLSSLSLADRKKVLAGWQNGMGWRKLVFNAMKEMSYLAYYSQTGSWSSINYSGPLVRSSADSVRTEFYQKLKAPS